MFLHFLLYATLLQQTTFAISYPVTKRSDLPTIPTTCPGIQLYWNEQIISELGFVALLLQTYHSGVTAKLLPSSKPECNNMPLLNANGIVSPNRFGKVVCLRRDPKDQRLFHWDCHVVRCFGAEAWDGHAAAGFSFISSHKACAARDDRKCHA